MTRIAVLDLGTNTFHLAIADVSAGNVNFLLREQRFVKLAEEGIELIGKKPFERGIHVLQEYRHLIDRYGVERVESAGTAALRSARNGQDFLNEAGKLGFDVRLISGEEEAELIWRGVRAAVDFRGKSLVLDIGGGSAEFIFAEPPRPSVTPPLQEGSWRITTHSFPIGGAVLRRKFHHHDPITEDEIAALNGHLDQAIGSILTPVETLIGASGTFESLVSMLNVPTTIEELFGESPSREIAISDFASLRDKLIASTMSARLQWPGLIPERADMVVVATLLVDYVLRKTKATRLVVSNYALKEGLMLSLADDQPPAPKGR